MTTALFRWMVFCLLIDGHNASAGILHLHIDADGIHPVTHNHPFCVAVHVNEWNADELSPDAQIRYETIDRGALLALADRLGYDASQTRCGLLRLINMLALRLSFVVVHLSQALGYSLARVVEADFLTRIHHHVPETARWPGGRTAEV